MEPSVLSLLPPFLVLLLIIKTKKLVISIAAGILSSALILCQGNIGLAVEKMVDVFVSIFYADDMLNLDNILLLLFIFLLGSVTAFIEKNGGTIGFTRWSRKHVKSAVGAQLVAVVLGIIIFIDDYFNALTVGEVSRPLTDQYKVSREKLAYIIDSTAAPVCSICPLSSWGAYIIALFTTLFAAQGIEGSSFLHFLMVIPYNFYAILALAVVLLSSFLNINLGKMRYRERKAELQEVSGQGKEKASDLVLPIALLVFVSLFMIGLSGYLVGGSFDLFSIIENSSMYVSLVCGSLAALAYCLYRYHHLHMHEYSKTALEGMKSVASATLALVLAWGLIDMIASLNTGMYISNIFQSMELPVMLLPFLLFVVSTIMAIATGFSWGVFGLMLPIGIQISMAMEPELLYVCLGAVLSGCVCGDHCSPISDTTILSSAGAKCEHVAHVASQMPYAIYTALIASTGFLMYGFTENLLLAALVQILTLLLSGMLLVRANKRSKRASVLFFHRGLRKKKKVRA